MGGYGQSGEKRRLDLVVISADCPERKSDNFLNVVSRCPEGSDPWVTGDGIGMRTLYTVVAIPYYEACFAGGIAMEWSTENVFRNKVKPASVFSENPQ